MVVERASTRPHSASSHPQPQALTSLSPFPAQLPWKEDERWSINTSCSPLVG
jgi:hypothetical protein